MGRRREDLGVRRARMPLSTREGWQECGISLFLEASKPVTEEVL
jgi:hypothetical protein